MCIRAYEKLPPIFVGLFSCRRVARATKRAYVDIVYIGIEMITNKCIIIMEFRPFLKLNFSIFGSFFLFLFY